LNNPEKKSVEVIAILATSIASLFLSFMIRTLVLRIVFASSFFLLSLLLMFLLFSAHDEKVNPRLKLKKPRSWMIYCIAIVSSIVLLCFPVARYAFDDAWIFFVSLDAVEVIRVIAGYFILAIFPGYVAHRCFARNNFDNSYENLALIFALSYVISIVLGLSLSQTIGFSLVNYLCSLWVFVLLCETLHYVFESKNGVPVISTTKRTSNDIIKKSLVILVCLFLIFSAYIITLSADPRDISLGGDITRYLTDSTAFLQNQQIDSSYLWFQIFLSIASVLTGLHPLHAFVGMQFIIVLFPLSFYTLLIKIFGDYKIATIGTTVTAITGGLSSIGILGLFHTYNEQSVFAALWDLRIKTQNWPWLSNHCFIVATMDWSLLMLGFGFIYCFIKRKRSGRLNYLILGSLFLVSTFFTHNVTGVMIGLTTILVFSVFNHMYLKRALVFVLSFLFALIVFDALSYNFFIKTLINYYLHYQVFFASSALFPYQWGIITILLLLFSVPFIPRLAKNLRKKIKFVENGMLSSKSIASICVIITLVVSIISLAMIAIRFNYLNLPEETIFPWYIYVVRFSPLIQLAILSVPIILKMKDKKRIGFFLMVSWCLLAIWMLVLNVVFPRFVTPILVNRILMSIYLPLGALSALTLSSLNMIKLSKVRFKLNGSHVKISIKKILMFTLIMSIGFSFLSHAYSIELFYQGNKLSSMSSEEKNLYTYLADLPPEKTFLTYSSTAYQRISALTMHTTYAYYQYGAFTSWSAEILFTTSSPEIANYFLHKLGITHIVITKQDASTLLERKNNALIYMLDFFPIVFNNSFATVYSTPHYFSNESSNYSIVKPSTSLTPEFTSESLIYDPIGIDNLRIVGGGSKFKFENGTIVQQVQDIKSPSAQYLQLYKGIAIPMAVSPIASFKIKGIGNALYNIGFYDNKIGWYWLSHERGLPNSFFGAPDKWTEINIDLQSILGNDAMILYIDFVATSSDGSPIEVEWKDFDISQNISVSELVSSAYSLAYNSLVINEVPFATIEDYKALNLAPNKVFVLSDSWANDVWNEELFEDVKTGAHAVFLYSSRAFSEYSCELFYLLGIESRGITSVNNVHIDEEIHSVPSNSYIANITARSSLYTYNIMGYYTTLENTSIPLIIYFTVGNGSIMFINLPNTINLDRTLADIAIKTIKKAFSVLPKPTLSNVSKTVPYPEDLFKLGNPNLINIYKLNGLTDYIYAFSDIELEGNISMSSDYVIWNEKDITLKTLILQNTTHQKIFENVLVPNLHFVGSYNTRLTTQDAIIYNLGGELPLIKTSPNFLRIHVEEPAINLTIKQNGEEISLNISRSDVQIEFSKDVTTDLRLQKPLIELNPGSLDTSWKGVFWYDGKMFTTVARAEHWVINGSFLLEVIHSENVTISKLLYKDNISVGVDD
jgi:hypothetical protein